MPKQPSKYWMFFQKIDRNTAECRLCGKHLRTCGNTTNLGKHIKRHPNYRELSGHNGDSDDEKHPIKVEKVWNSTGSAEDLDELSDTAYDDKSTEIVYLEDPLLGNENSAPEMKPNIKELMKEMGTSPKLNSRPGNNSNDVAIASKKIKLAPTTSSSNTSSSSMFNMEAAHLAFAEFFFACNIPFKVLNSMHLKRFISKLNRAYRPPSMRELTTTYLDRAFDKYNPAASVTEQNAILMLSGWKDFTNDERCVVACLYLTGENETRVFLNTWDLNIDFLADENDTYKAIIEQSIKLAKELYNAKIFTILSDNPQLNVSSYGMLFWTSLCQCYLAGCLAQDIINPNDARQVKLILNEFQQEDIECLIIERGGARILLPWEKRWCTYRDSFQCFIKNNPIIRQLITEEKCLVPSNVREIIFNDEFLNKIENYFAILEPLCKLIYLTQKKKTTLAEVVEEWLQLVFPDEYQNHLQNRRNMALTPFALAANFMHPIYRGQSMSDNQQEAVEFFFLENLDSKGLDDMFLFKKNEGIFAVLAEKQITTCSTYWCMAGRKHPELTALSKKLLSIPASVSYIDKIFSSWSTTHLSARNLLGMDVYRKLTKTHFVLNLGDSS